MQIASTNISEIMSHVVKFPHYRTFHSQPSAALKQSGSDQEQRQLFQSSKRHVEFRLALCFSKNKRTVLLFSLFTCLAEQRKSVFIYAFFIQAIPVVEYSVHP